MMDVNERYNLITRNLQEIIGDNELKELLKNKKEISVYWGTMPTGSISIAYFFPMLKIADFLKAGLKVKILLADLHAVLDSVPWSLVEKRYNYYKHSLILILKTIGVDTKKLEFVKGSDYQLGDKYVYDLLKLSTLSSTNDATRAASEAVKSAKEGNVKVSGLIYPLMQALDEEYLQVDIQFAGLDQRKILVYAREFLPKIGYKQRVELMNPMIRGLVGKQMSSSIEATKIDLLDEEEKVRNKIKKAECVEGNSDNGIMAILQYLIFNLKSEFLVERDAKHGGDLIYHSYSEVERDFKQRKLHPLDLKNTVAKEINLLLENFRNNKKLRELHSKAY